LILGQKEGSLGHSRIAMSIISLGSFVMYAATKSAAEMDSVQVFQNLNRTEPKPKIFKSNPTDSNIYLKI